MARVCHVAYLGIPMKQEVDIPVEMFCNMFGDKNLKRWSLAVPTAAMVSAVTGAKLNMLINYRWFLQK